VTGNPLLYAAVALDLALLLLAVYWAPLADLLSTAPLSTGELGATLAASLIAPAACEVAKARRRRTAAL
jgi:hypothetical protein